MTDAKDPLQSLLNDVAAGRISPDAARQQMQSRDAESLAFATLDHGRRERCGMGEVIFAAGKTAAQVVEIAGKLREREGAVLITRANSEHIAALRKAWDSSELQIGERSGCVLIGEPQPVQGACAIPVVTAGTSDEPIAEEAAMTCRAFGHPVHRINDVGVAGLHRLLSRVHELRKANVIVCIAGMEGALPSVVGGLVACPVIAVPTSVGYGVNLGGLSALLGMLTSCASGVVAVNIDNGFGAAYAACQINQPREDHHA